MYPAAEDVERGLKRDPNRQEKRPEQKMDGPILAAWV